MVTQRWRMAVCMWCNHPPLKWPFVYFTGLFLGKLEWVRVFVLDKAALVQQDSWLVITEPRSLDHSLHLSRNLFGSCLRPLSRAAAFSLSQCPSLSFSGSPGSLYSILAVCLIHLIPVSSPHPLALSFSHSLCHSHSMSDNVTATFTQINVKILHGHLQLTISIDVMPLSPKIERSARIHQSNSKEILILAMSGYICPYDRFTTKIHKGKCQIYMWLWADSQQIIINFIDFMSQFLILEKKGSFLFFCTMVSIAQAYRLNSWKPQAWEKCIFPN